jgi:hypothetical protein
MPRIVSCGKLDLDLSDDLVPSEYSNLLLMRHTLVVLSNLRTLLQVRSIFLLVLAAVFMAVTPSAIALQGRVPRKAPAHRHASSARAHTASRQVSRSVRSSAASRRSLRRQPRIVRARMPIRRYRWMAQRRAAAHPVVPRSHAFAAESVVADADDTNSSTPQEAANRIAAAEVPAQQAALRVPANPFGNTRIVAMAPLRGSLESLIRQNEKTNADNLERIEDDADLRARIANGQLVRVPESASLAVNPSLPVDRRYCRPWTAAFLTDLAHAHRAQFSHPFEVSSAVRTVEYQKHLMRTNGNAAPAVGDVASPHLTGATIDIAKRGLTHSEIYWMRNRLDALQNEGKIDVEEEFRQSCFHITVYKSYIGAGPVHKPAPHTVAPPDDGTDSQTDLPAHPA